MFNNWCNAPTRLADTMGGCGGVYLSGYLRKTEKATGRRSYRNLTRNENCETMNPADKKFHNIADMARALLGLVQGNGALLCQGGK
jgi:hypothetical protein